MTRIYRIFSVVAALAILLSSCQKPEVEVPDKEDPNTEVVDPGDKPDVPGPVDPVEPVDPQYEEGTLYVIDEDGQELATFKMETNIAFTVQGYYTFYALDMGGLTKDDFDNIGEDYTGKVIVGAKILPSSNNKSIDVCGAEKTFQFATLINDFLLLSAVFDKPDPDIKEGSFTLNVDRDALTSSFSMDITTTSGFRLVLNTTGSYIPGDEVTDEIEWADWGVKPLRSAFYLKRDKAGYEPLLYFAPAQFDYLVEFQMCIFYAVVDISTAACDGNIHSIADLTASGDLTLQVWHGEKNKDESHWDIIDGDISVTKKGDLEYTISIIGAYAEDMYGYLPFYMWFDGKIWGDASLEKPKPDNKYIIDKTDEHIIGSVVVDVTSSETVSYIYMCEKVGVTTVEAMANETPVVISVSRQYLGSAAGFSTDPNLSFSYGDRVWNKSNTSTGSYICDELDLEGHYIGLKVRNIDKSQLFVDYNGSIVVE